MTDKETESARNAGTMMALIFLSVGGAAFIFLVAMVLPQLVRFFFVLALVPGAFALHYVVWGWWLSSVVNTEEIEARERTSSTGVPDQDSEVER